VAGFGGKHDRMSVAALARPRCRAVSVNSASELNERLRLRLRCRHGVRGRGVRRICRRLARVVGAGAAGMVAAVPPAHFVVTADGIDSTVAALAWDGRDIDTR